MLLGRRRPFHHTLFSSPGVGAGYLFPNVLNHGAVFVLLGAGSEATFEPAGLAEIGVFEASSMELGEFVVVVFPEGLFPGPVELYGDIVRVNGRLLEVQDSESVWGAIVVIGNALLIVRAETTSQGTFLVAPGDNRVSAVFFHLGAFFSRLNATMKKSDSR